MRVLLTAIVIVLMAAVGASATAYEDPRTHEVVRFDCTTGLARSEVTLFGNGTLRLREGDVGEEEMALAELAPEVLDGYLRRLQMESMGGGLAPPKRIDGLWTEQCVLILEVPDGPSGRAEFGAFDSLDLPLSRVVAIARELVTLARSRTVVAGIDPGYVPQRGDILIAHDGTRYRVNVRTMDGTGVELVGIDQPLSIYVLIETLHEQFLAIESP